MVVVAAAGTGGAHKVLLISGKQTGSSNGSQAGFNRPISVVLPSNGNQTSSDSDSNTSGGPPVRKRQRLTHLSPEEKALRRLVSLRRHIYCHIISVRTLIRTRKGCHCLIITIRIRPKMLTPMVEQWKTGSAFPIAA